MQQSAFPFFTKWISNFFPSVHDMHNKLEYELFLSNEDLESGDGLIGKYVVNIGFLFNRLQGKGNQLPSIKSSYCIMKYYFLYFLHHWIKDCKIDNKSEKTIYVRCITDM